MTVRGAVFLGIGAMVGAGIFALLGEAGAVAGSAVWLSFLLSGTVAALLGYTVVKLGVRYPSSGGLIAYLVEGFGNGRLVGIASWLGYFSAIVIVCSMVAVAFGSYASSLFSVRTPGAVGQRLHVGGSCSRWSRSTSSAHESSTAPSRSSSSSCSPSSRSSSR